MFTSSALSTPRFTRERSGCGSPKRTSETSVAIIEPPQPSASAVRAAAMQQVLGVVVHAHVGHVQPGDDLAVDAARRGACRRPVLLLLLGGAADVDQDALLLAELGQTADCARSLATSSSLRPSRAMPYSSARARSRLGPADLVGLGVPSAASSRAWTTSRAWSECAAVAGADVPQQVPGDNRIRPWPRRRPPARPCRRD